MKVDLRREVLDHLVAVYQRRVLNGPGGELNERLFEPGSSRKRLRRFGGFVGPSAALLALGRDDANPFYGQSKLLDLAMLAGDRLVLDHADVGTPSNSKPNHFHIYPLAPLYELAGEQASAGRRRAWRETMARNLRATEQMIDRCASAMGRPHPWAGTGPNHFFGWLGVAYRQARILEDDALMNRIERAMLKQLELQAPGGYFPEHIGPAVLYQTVSLEGIGMFHQQRPRKESGEALQRGVGFLVRSLYPDLRFMDTFDERNRLSGPVGYSAFLAWTAEGRSLLRQVLERQRQALARPGKDLDAWSLGALHRTLEQVEAVGSSTLRPLPLETERFAWKLEDRGLVRKEGAWFYVLSAWPDALVSGNPYFLQRTQALSIYHEKTGLIVGGGNDKFAPFNATVCVVEAKECVYSPPVEAKLDAGRPPRVLKGGARCDRVVLDYGSTQATLEVAAESQQRLRLGVSAVSNMAGHEIFLVLQLPLTAPVTLKSGGKPVRLAAAREGQETRVFPLGNELEGPAGWRMRLPKGAALMWPHFPWNPYRPPNYRSVPGGAVALLRVPLRAPHWRTEVMVELKL